MEQTRNFVAIDFEWQGHNHDACAVGMVKVIDGVTVGKFYSLIKPKVEVWDIYTVRKHGITADLCKDAPTFAELEPMMESFIGDLLLVGHNYDEAERCVLEKHTREGSPLRDAPFFDTMKGDGRGLDERCAEYDIPLETHHDALEDAMATAMLYMKMLDIKPKVPAPGDVPKGKMVGPKRDSSLNAKPDLDSVEHKDNPFFDKMFVVSGFGEEQRDLLIQLLSSKLGGTNRSDISGKVNILISHTSQDGTEHKAGGSKRKKAIKLGIPYYNEHWLYSEVIVKYGLEKEWKEIFG